MKRTLYTKIFTGFILFGICGFLIVATVTSRLSFQKLKDNEVQNLYEEATVISSLFDGTSPIDFSPDAEKRKIH